VKEEKGFLHREVKQVTLPRYYPSSLEIDPDWMIIFFSSILIDLEWKKWKNQLIGPFLPT